MTLPVNQDITCAFKLVDGDGNAVEGAQAGVNSPDFSFYQKTTSGLTRQALTLVATDGAAYELVETGEGWYYVRIPAIDNDAECMAFVSGRFSNTVSSLEVPEEVADLTRSAKLDAIIDLSDETKGMRVDLSHVNGDPIASLQGTAIKAHVVSHEPASTTSAAFAANALAAAAIATDAVNKIRDGILNAQPAEPTSAPVVGTATLQELLTFLAALGIDKIINNGTSQTLRNVADTLDVATAPVSQDAVSTIKGRYE